MEKKMKPCTCGKSRNPPYCDHSHEQLEAMPVKKRLCTCGKSRNPPYCDHSHEQLEAMPVKKRLCTCGKSKNPPYCDHSHPHTAAPPVKIEPISNKILLVILPFWTPLVPPQGISFLKHFLQQHSYVVKTADANTKTEFIALYNQYFNVLKEYIPPGKQGNFYNIGHDVLRNHMMAHIHKKNQNQYNELVKIIINQTFFTLLTNRQVKALNEVLDAFYAILKVYFLEMLAKERPAVVGVSVLRDTVGPSLFALRLIKETDPHIKTVIGGSIFSDHLLKDTPNFEFFLEKTPYIDKIVIGEGHHLFLKLLKGEFPGSQRVFTLADIGGQTVGFSPNNIPDMSDFSVKQDYPYLAAGASSSCPYQCSFCNVAAFYGQYREKDPEQTAAEMISLYKKYDTQLFFMTDALLNNVITPLAKEFLKKNISVYWDGYLRVDEALCDVENTMLWRRGGFYRARLGVESGSQHVLDLMDKNITPAQTKKALACLANSGIKTTTYWVIGHPGETEEDFLQTLELLEELKNNIYEAECNPFIHGYRGQGKSDRWKDKQMLLYPAQAKDMLVMQTWLVEGEPSREETYKRVCRFVRHCQKLGIPNPYSMEEIFKADERWAKLHKNAVPNLVDFKDSNSYNDENKYVKKLVALEKTLPEEGDFDF